MGFNLEVMFLELEGIIAAFEGEDDKWEVLKKELAWWKNYAIDCGEIQPSEDK